MLEDLRSRSIEKQKRRSQVSDEMTGHGQIRQHTRDQTRRTTVATTATDHIILTMNHIIIELDDQEALARLDERNRYGIVEIDSKPWTLRHRSIRYLFEIESFVRAIEKEYKDAGHAKGMKQWVDQTGHWTFEKLPLAEQYYGKLNGWIDRYSDKRRYSARVEAFHDACKELGMLGKQRFVFGEPPGGDWDHGVFFTDWFNTLIEKTYERTQTYEFKERERLLKIHVQRNIDNVMAFEQALFADDCRSQWLILSLTLQYQTKYRNSITIEDVQRDRERFFAARRFKNLMKPIEAYVWAIEEGEDSGFHLHVILFYLPVTKHDEATAQAIGEYWVSVTQGKGVFWNSNQDRLKPGYERNGHGVGVGLIDYRDRKMRGALRENLRYLAKGEQHLQIRAEGNIHTFDMSDVPKKVKAGRPRVDHCKQAAEIDEKIDREVKVNSSDDIPWDYSVV